MMVLWRNIGVCCKPRGSPSRWGPREEGSRSMSDFKGGHFEGSCSGRSGGTAAIATRRRHDRSPEVGTAMLPRPSSAAFRRLCPNMGTAKGAAEFGHCPLVTNLRPQMDGQRRSPSIKHQACERHILDDKQRAESISLAGSTIDPVTLSRPFLTLDSPGWFPVYRGRIP
jgi:hypothetical protein